MKARELGSIAVNLAKDYYTARAEIVTVVQRQRTDGTISWDLQYGGIDYLATHRNIEALEIEGPWYSASAMARDIYGAMREIESTVD